MGARTSNLENFCFLIEIHCTSLYIMLMPRNQLLCLQVNIMTMQQDHIATHTPRFIRIEKGLELVPGPRTSIVSYRNPLYINVYLPAAPTPALDPASRYNYNAAILSTNTYTRFDKNCKGFRTRARIWDFENFYFLIEIHCTSMYMCLLTL